VRPNIGVLRSAILPMLTETGRIDRTLGHQPLDEEIGAEEPIFATIYVGRCLVQPRGPMREREAGGQTVAVTHYDVTLPADTPAQRGDRLTLDTAQYDTALVGATFTIVDIPVDPWQIARFAVAERYT
jgi:hypothetical protein